MKTVDTVAGLSGQAIVDLTKAHTLFEWSAQNAVDPIPVSGAKGCWFWTPDGKRFLDFNSQLMCVNVGHGDERVVRAIQQQAATLAYANPFMATEPRARLGKKLAEICPGDIDVFFFTNGGAEANENAIKLARQYTGRHKVLSFYRSYHGATAGSMMLTGDPRRWAAEPGMPGVVHVLNPYHGVQRGWDTAAAALARIEETIELEGAQTIAAFFLEPVTGTNGVLIPPDGFIQGVRDLCTKYGILMVADEVMSGFGRTGEWFAIDHWHVVPDLMTMAKGLTSAYVPLGAVGMRRPIADYFRERVFYGGLTYNSHPLACAAALATVQAYEEDGLIDNARRMGALMKTLMDGLVKKHAIVGAARAIGLFGLVELVKDRTSMEPLAPFNGTSE
ncbi:MAG: aminotransferase class III-fold pyridoxal phosphate-dependent enzyme, partial [Vicinamibacterales bacterium]